MTKQYRYVKKYKAFTLIEVIVVIALISIISVVSIVAIRPSHNIAATEDSARRGHVVQIKNGIVQFLVEENENDSLIPPISACTSSTGAGGEEIGTGSGRINLIPLLVPNFIAAIPMDPDGGTQIDTGYEICTVDDNKFLIYAPNASTGAIYAV